MGTVSRYNYLVILLPGARAALVDNFACEQRVLGGIHLRVLGLLRESLEGLGSCKKQKKNRNVALKHLAKNGEWEVGRGKREMENGKCWVGLSLT